MRRSTSCATTGLEHRILIVDDGSPDGTGEIADRLAAEHAEVEVLHRPGQGRASAPPTSRASSARSPAARSWCSRWTPTSRTTRPTCRA